MPKARRKADGNVLQFPTDEEPFLPHMGNLVPDAISTLNQHRKINSPEFGSKPEKDKRIIGGVDDLDVVICGTFRRDVEGLRNSFDELRDLGFNVLSPARVDIATEEQGFVYMRGEETQTPENLELRHLEAIQRARLVWLHAPEGYVGPTAALELGFARASGIPVFSTGQITDIALRAFVKIVSSPRDLLEDVGSHKLPPPPPALTVFQHYYKSAAAKRGYESESAQNCLLLMIEEVGELARAVRKKERLVRHGAKIQNAEALELADVFIYVVHMANILSIDLGQAVQEKELLNIQKLLR